MPTIKYLIEQNCRIILASHLGRPKGEVKPEFSLAPVAKELSKLLGQEVLMAKDVIGESAKLLAGDYPVKIEPAFRKALDDIYLQEGTFLITGSLYFISEVRKYLLQKIHSK